MSWYKMHRGWQDHEVFADEKYTEREAWEWLISNACFEPKVININGNPIDLSVGQLSYAIRYLAEAWQWHRSKTSRFLDKLKKWGMIETQTETGQLILTICNYSVFQSDRDKSETAIGTTPRQERDKSETNNKNLRTKEIKEKIYKKENISNSDFDEDQSSKTTPPKIIADRMIEVWNSVCGDTLGQVVKLTNTRKQKLVKRWKEDFGESIEQWTGFCNRIISSDFLSGKNQSNRDRPWKASFDWVLNPQNLAKIIEGNYDNEKAHRPKTRAEQTSELSDFQQRLVKIGGLDPIHASKWFDENKISLSKNKSTLKIRMESAAMADFVKQRYDLNLDRALIGWRDIKAVEITA